MKMTLDEYFEFYRAKTVPAYSNLIALKLEKTEQILIEEANIVSHIAQYYNPNLSDEVKERNLQKAFNHLQRVTLDIHKMIWITLSEKLEKIIDDDVYRLAMSYPEHEVAARYTKFLNSGVDARVKEMKNVGNDLDSSIEAFEQISESGWELLMSIDNGKLKKLKGWKMIFKTKEFFIGILMGLVSAAIFEILRYVL